MKKNATAKALVMSVLALTLCLSMLVGTTFAWFTDSVKSGVNKIVAGNLDVEMEYAKVPAGTTPEEGDWHTVQDVTELFMPVEGDGSTLWEPGHTEYVYLRIRNAGTLALKYQLAVNVYGDERGGEEQQFTNKNGDKFKLSEHLVFTQTDGVATVNGREDLWIPDAAAEAAAMGKLNDLGKIGVLLPNEEKTVTLAVYMPTQVGNEANQLTAAAGETAPTIFLGLTLNATQTPYESDSFDDKYDANANGTPDYDFGKIAFSQTTADVVENEDTVLTNDDGTLQMTVPYEAIAEGQNKLTLTVSQRETMGAATIRIAEGQAFTAYDVSVATLKTDNTMPITVQLYVGQNKTVGGVPGIEMYHYGNKLTAVDHLDALTGSDQFYYDSESGYVTYTSTSFSPFTIVYDNTFTVTYKTNADVVMGTVTYPVGQENSVPADTNEFVAYFRDFVLKVQDGGQSVYSGMTYWLDKEFTRPATTLDGTIDTVYVKLSNYARVDMFTCGGQTISAPYADNYSIAIANGSSWAPFGYFAMSGYSASGVPSDAKWIFTLEKLDGSNGWTALDDSYHTDPYGTEWDNMLYFKGVDDSGTYRIGKVAVVIRDADGNALYYDYAQIPSSVFEIIITD